MEAICPQQNSKLYIISKCIASEGPYTSLKQSLLIAIKF